MYRQEMEFAGIWLFQRHKFVEGQLKKDTRGSPTQISAFAPYRKGIVVQAYKTTLQKKKAYQLGRTLH